MLVVSLTTALLLLVPTLLLASGSGNDPASREFNIVSNLVNWGYDVALQADGKIVVAGHQGHVDTRAFDPLAFQVARFNTDGSLDTSFGDEGATNIHFLTPEDSSIAYSLAIQPDGKIVAAGSTTCDTQRCYSGNDNELYVALARFNPDGSLDDMFGASGLVTVTLLSGYGSADALALQPDGKIVLAGSTYPMEGPYLSSDLMLMRFRPDGTLDPDFGTRGIVVHDFSQYAAAHSLAIQGDGKIVVAGRGDGAVLARYERDGTPDSTFGEEGIVSVTLDDLPLGARALSLQPDGKILLAASGAGWESCPNQADFVLARYTVDGGLDPTFGEEGWVKTDFGGNLDAARDVTIQPDGRILVVGHSRDSSQPCQPPVLSGRTGLAAARYLQDGSLDSSFHVNGRYLSSFAEIRPRQNDVAEALALQPDGNIIVTGAILFDRQNVDIYNNMGLIRFSADQAPHLYFPLVRHAGLGD